MPHEGHGSWRGKDAPLRGLSPAEGFGRGASCLRSPAAVLPRGESVGRGGASGMSNLLYLLSADRPDETYRC